MNTQKIIVGLLVLVLVFGAGVALYSLKEKDLEGQILVPPLPTPAEPASKVYKNEYMQVTVPEDWKLTEVVRTEEGAQVQTGAVNITKGKYVLYIHPRAQQASGVTGGRFAEIAQGSPSADAVVTVQPSEPCGTAVVGEKVSTLPFSTELTRQDLYVSSAEKKEYCATPASGKTVWYFSYLTDYRKGYINYFKADEPPGYVITMSYNSTDINSFPVKGTPELNAALTEMTSMLKTLHLKEWDKITR